MNLEEMITQCRQWLFPREFRIELDGSDAWTELLAALMSEENAGTAEQPPANGKTGGKTDEGQGASSPSGRIDASFATQLSNGLHRLKRSVTRVEKSGSNPREVENIKRAFERADPLLEAYGIRYLDLTGQRYDPGREDFDPLPGRPEEVAGLVHPTISLCECPAVYLHEKLVQQARGTVAVPPAK